MLKKIFKSFIGFIEWNINLFDLQKLRLKTAEKYNLHLNEHDAVEKVYKIWKWVGIFYLCSSYFLFTAYLFLKYYNLSYQNVLSQFFEIHILFFLDYIICNGLQRFVMDENIKQDKEPCEK